MNVRDVFPHPGPAAAPERETLAFDLSGPEGWSPGDEAPSPFLFASPHSGRLYPADMLDASALGPEAIRRSEDAFVDRLVAAGPRHGAVLIAARYARAYVDLNREAWELDPAMFSDELPAFARRRTPRVAAGLGSIARVVADGQEIYSRKLTFAEAEQRIAQVYRPYHTALDGLLRSARTAHGASVLIDWHSMPAAAGEAGRGRRSFDMVLGDRFGAACAPGLTTHVERELQAMGYNVARNAPYAGGYITEYYGRPADGAHALQVEINRGLYLKPGSLEPAAGFDRLAADLEQLFESLSRHWRSLL
jgi:N-formylglutamate amidohydrolase